MEVRRFGRHLEQIPVPNLVEMKVKAYRQFLQRETAPHKRKNVGLEAILREIFPVKSYDGSATLEYLGYELGQPRYTPDECRQLRLSYGAPLKLRMRLVKTEPIEEEVYLGEIPLMVGSGEFVINGAERVIVSQLHRSPGIDFSEERVGDKKVHSCCIIPERGSWIEIVVTRKETFAIRIDQGGKIPLTTFLRATSPELSTNADIIRIFHKTSVVKLGGHTDPNALVGKYVVSDIVDPNTKEKIIASAQPIVKGMPGLFIDAGVKEVEIVSDMDDPIVVNTLQPNEDGTVSHEDALMKIYSRLRPGTPPNIDKARHVFYERFFDPQRYRLGRVGRFRLNRKFELNVPEEEMTIQKEDIINATRYLLKLRRGEGHVDDIDHLGNRRIRTIDELCGDEVRKGFLRLKRSIMERMSSNSNSNDNMTPKTIVNSKTVSSAIEYFFARGELSQVVDQTNPLSQLTHERRLSALGPGGLNRKRAGFEVRDVHVSHYGRICPIETPEGTNIGLISSLAVYSSVDDYGFLITPYFVVKNGKITKEIAYLRADEEVDKIIGPADMYADDSGRIIGEKVLARVNGEFQHVEPTKIQYRDVSPIQMTGVSAALIPFLEHDDANRALLGSNMQRQAVPLLVTEKPIIATGMEAVVAENTSMVVKAEKNGTVRKVDSTEIVVDDDVYPLKKFSGLNERTCLNQKPLVREGDKVRAGQIIADGAATKDGELALGRDLTVAFLPMEGFNFEDAIVVSERLVKEDVFTSIHIEEFEVEARETKLGKEEFTKDIPNVSEKALANLDESGIVQVGTHVQSGDVLVGKIAPKSKSELTPEEKLLHAIFGRAGEDVKNDSLEVPSGVEGVVINTKKFSRKVNLSSSDARKSRDESRRIEREYNGRINDLLAEGMDKLKDILGRRPLPKDFSYGDKRYALHSREIKQKLNLDLFDIKGKKQRDDAEAVVNALFLAVESVENEKDKKINLLTRGEELPTGVLEMVKVYVATKRKLSVGDKMSGRHGNKGVVAKIMPEEDMPFLEDGTIVDIVLNPLGVPSRMNVGQILETHLGWAARKLGIRIITPPFDGANEEDIVKLLENAGLPTDGKVTLYDGRTGESYHEKVTVGVMHIMKLHHLVDDKIHARATGPYSLITQQPLGGKARCGGQRFGEMEVWALEAYGAANILHELLTVKSDDVDGRTKIYESMVRGENVLEPSTPVSFEVLVNEIKGLGLNLKMEKAKEIKLEE